MSAQLPTQAMQRWLRRGRSQFSATRAFSSTPLLSKKQNSTDPSLNRRALKGQQQQKAPLSLQQEAMQRGDGFLDDMGIIPGTFIRIPFRESWRKIPVGKRFSYEVQWLRTRLGDAFGRIMYKWRSGIKPRPNTSRVGLVEAAKQMHLDIYEAFAERNQKAISEICLSSMSEHFSKRLQQIPKNTQLEWTRNRILGERSRVNPLSWITFAGPRIVSNRAMQLSLPGLEQTGLRQVVVRLPTSQTLRTTRTSSQVSHERPRRQLAWTPDGEQPERAAAVQARSSVTTFEDDVIEYMVLQKRIVRGVPEEWRVWGFAQPTDTERIVKDKEFEQRLRAYQSSGSSLA